MQFSAARFRQALASSISARKLAFEARLCARILRRTQDGVEYIERARERVRERAENRIQKTEKTRHKSQESSCAQICDNSGSALCSRLALTWRFDLFAKQSSERHTNCALIAPKPAKHFRKKAAAKKSLTFLARARNNSPTFISRERFTQNNVEASNLDERRSLDSGVTSQANSSSSLKYCNTQHTAQNTHNKTNIQTHAKTETHKQTLNRSRITTGV